MKRLAHPDQVPPSGYRYTDPQTKTTFRGIDLREVLRLARTHRQANHLPISPNFDQVAIDRMCGDYPPGWCTDDKPAPKQNLFSRLVERVAEGFGVEKLKRGSRALFSLLKHANLVDRDTMSKRAAICNACPLRVVVHGCFGCSGIGSIARAAMGRERDNQALAILRGSGPGEAQRIGCAPCGCYLPAKVWLSQARNLEVTPRNLLEKMHPKCWLRSPV